MGKEPVFTFTSHSPEETRQLGERLGQLATAGDIFLLSGDLGAGKTCLTQGIAVGLGVKEKAKSPTFVLVREMKGRMPLYHADLYRLDNMAEIAELGLEEYLYGNGLTVIEWAEKGTGLLPPECLVINIAIKGSRTRLFNITAGSAHYHHILEQIKGRAC